MRSESEEPKENVNPTWSAISKERLSACDNRPGLKKMYVRVFGDDGNPLTGVKVCFDTEPSEGIAYDHLNVWGLTDEDGYLEWNHLGIPTRYRLWMGDDDEPLIENIRTDLGNEYCNPGSRLHPGGWRPVNKPGVYSYRFMIGKVVLT